MATRNKKPERWSRKGRCPGCNVGSGSKHREDCTYDYARDVVLPRAVPAGVKTLELKGYISPHDGDIFLEKEKYDEDDYYYPRESQSLGAMVADHFSKIVKGVEIAPSDWTRGTIHLVDNVFCQYYITNEPKSWDEATADHVREMAGGLQTEDVRTGYSEYTITESWTEIFVGGHDLNKELETHKWKYVIIRINYRT